MKVALIHEFLTQSGGAERVLQNFREMFPDAPVFTLVDKSKAAGIRTGFLNILAKYIPYKWLLPLMPLATEQIDLKNYDLVLSDSSAFAKGVITTKPTIHISYCHTPTRYIWENHDEYIANLRLPKFMKMLAHIYIKNHLQKWDYQAAQRPDFIIANSQTVRDRIKKYYDRDAEVIYPPVDTEFFNNNAPQPPLNLRGGEGELYFLTASRLEPYKKIGLVVEAFNKLGLKLKVAGSGTDMENLKAKAKSNIEFLGRVSDIELRNLYAGARTFVFPALEDAGIMVLEALSCGTPVIGLAAGGTAEFVQDGENGVLFKEQTAESIISAVERFITISFESQKIRETVLQYDKKEFKRKIRSFINNVFANDPPAGGERGNLEIGSKSADSSQ